MDLFHPGTPSPPGLDARVRVIADIAGALIQIHDNTGLPKPHRRHGRLTPRHILVGVDGSASLFNAREPFSKLLPPQPDLGYLAPELLTQSGPATQQSDVFSLGVLLWEALDNGRLFPHRRAAAISRLIARRSLPGPRIEEEWALRLGEVAMKALCQNPEQRYPDGNAFWLALREHLPAPDNARHALSRLAQRALKLELTTDIRDVPPYLAQQVVGPGTSIPPGRPSLAEDAEREASARYSLHPERSSRLSMAGQAPSEDAAWALSEPPPGTSRLDLETLALAESPEPPPARPPISRSESPRPRASAPPAVPRSAYPAPRQEADNPISTLHVNLPRELLDASLPFYVSGRPASRPFPWGALSFAALIFFGVGAAVAFGAVTALRSPTGNMAMEGARAPNVSAAPVPAPVDIPSALAPAAPSVASPAPPAPVAAPEALAPAADEAAPAVAPPEAAAPATATTTATPPTATPQTDPQPVTDPGAALAAAEAATSANTAIKADGPAKASRRVRSRTKRIKPEPVALPEPVEAAPAPAPAPEIIREVPEDPPPSPPSDGTGETDSTEGLPFVDQPY